MMWTLTLLLAIQDKPAPYGFSGVELYKTSADAVGFAVGDLNGDGRTDFALANNSRTRIELFLQKSPDKIKVDAAKPPRFDDVNELHDDARFDKLLIPHESMIHALVAADLDGDGAPELAYHGDPPALVVYKRKGDRWEKSQELKIKPASVSHDSLVAGDLNGDGRNDLALLTPDGVALFLQNKNGRLDTPVVYPTGLEQASAIAVAKTKSGPALVLTREGAQNGIAVRPVVGADLGPEWILSTGTLLSVFTPPSNELSFISISQVSGRMARSTIIEQSTPEAVFETPAALYPLPIEKGGESRALAFGDLNGDGRLDAVVTLPSASTIDVYLQDANGNFKAPVRSSTFAGSSNVQVVDGGVLVASPEERVVGIAKWEGDRLGFPKSVGAVAGKPYAAAEVGKELAVVTENSGDYTLTVGTAAQPLKFLSENPSRLLPIDIDADGDQDLVVIQPRDPPGIVLNEGSGQWTPLSSDQFGGKWLLQDAKASAYARTVLPGGREALLVAKKNLGRAVALNKERKLEILEQSAAGQDANLTGLTRSGDFAVLLDEKSSTLSVLALKDKDWKSVQEIKLPTARIHRIETAVLAKGEEPSLILLGSSGFQILRRGKTQRALEADWSYESAVKDADLDRIAQGDLNADGRPDLLVTDLSKRSMEILDLPAKKGDDVKLGIRFEVFEEKSMGFSGGFTVRALTVADFTGDKKDDVLFLLHDRVVLYPQE